MSTLYSPLYEFDVSINNNTSTPIILSKDDIVSIAIVQDFDNAVFPMIRIRLYTDIDTLTYLNEDPNNLDLCISSIVGVYELNENQEVTDRVIDSHAFNIATDVKLKCYLENKNTPYTTYDNYQQGLQKDDSLNSKTKTPITLYCYDYNAIRNSKRKVSSIYKNTTLFEIVNHMATECEIENFKCIPFDNNEKYDQILIPNLSFIDALVYLDGYYGLYESGAMLTGHNPGYLVLTSSQRDYVGIRNIVNINVTSYKAGNSFSGLVVSDLGAFSDNRISTPDTSVVVKSKTDIEQTVNPKLFSSINVDNFSVDSSILSETFDNSDASNIEVPSIIHKTKNKFLASMYKTRVEEVNTQIDVSINALTYHQYLLPSAISRFMFSFDNAIRGIDINRYYRPQKINTVFTNIGSGKFSIQVTVQLC